MLTPEQEADLNTPAAEPTATPAPVAAKPAAKTSAKPASKKVVTKAEPKAKREHDESEGPAPTMVNGVYVGGDDSEPEVLEGVARARQLVNDAFSNQAQLNALHAVLDLVEAGE